MTPGCANDLSFCPLSVPGSHSNVISRPPSTARPRSAVRRALELLRREKRGRAAAEVHEVERPAGERRRRRHELPLAARASRGTARPAARSCSYRPGSNRNGSASGRTECAGTGRAARPAERCDCERGQRVGPPLPASTPKTAGNWRRNSCRPRFREAGCVRVSHRVCSSEPLLPRRILQGPGPCFSRSVRGLRQMPESGRRLGLAAAVLKRHRE